MLRIRDGLGWRLSVRAAKTGCPPGCRGQNRFPARRSHIMESLIQPALEKFVFGVCFLFALMKVFHMYGHIC